MLVSGRACTAGGRLRALLTCVTLSDPHMSKFRRASDGRFEQRPPHRKVLGDGTRAHQQAWQISFRRECQQQAPVLSCTMARPWMPAVAMCMAMLCLATTGSSASASSVANLQQRPDLATFASLLAACPSLSRTLEERPHTVFAPSDQVRVACCNDVGQQQQQDLSLPLNLDPKLR